MHSRIQPLWAPRAVPMVVVGVPEGAPLAEAALSLRAVDGFGGADVSLPLGELTRPFGAVHRQMLAAGARAHLAFAAEAAFALLDTELPILVVPGQDGLAGRPADLFQLFGEVPGAEGGAVVRVAVDRVAAHWVRHIDKHLRDGEVAEWHPGLTRLAGLGFGRAALKRALRNARRADGEPGFGGRVGSLRPSQWPLLEAYAAITVRVFEALAAAPALHLVRQAGPGAAAADSLLERILGDSLDLGPDEEALYVVPFGRVQGVARGTRSGSGPLPWRTTFPCAAAPDSLVAVAERVSAVPGVQVVELRP